MTDDSTACLRCCYFVRINHHPNPLCGIKYPEEIMNDVVLSMKTGYGSFGIIGGDKRQLYCARSLSDDGYAVALGGFDKVSQMKNVELATPFEAALMSEIIILPLPCINNSGCIPDSLSSADIELTPQLVSAMKGKRIFCGMKDRLEAVCPELAKNASDYYMREEFAVCNAVATAEGAIELAMRSFEGTINGARCLVCGYGRIGRALTRILCAMSADVTVSARKPSDLAWIELGGARPVRTENMYQLGEFDIIFNTVPAKILSCVLLAKIALHAVVIDLASGEGGVDTYAADRLGITTHHALSLPGKAAPKTAGEIVKKTIYHILEEDDR